MNYFVRLDARAQLYQAYRELNRKVKRIAYNDCEEKPESDERQHPRN